MENKLWGGRFNKGLDPIMKKFNASLSFDQRLYSADLLASINYAKAINGVNLITDEEYQLIRNGLQQILNEWKNGVFLIKDEDEDIHTANERRLKEIIGSEIGGKLHTGRSRNDQVATDMKIWLRDAIKELREFLLHLIQVLLERSEKEIDVLVPGYTHLQRAQPVYWSHLLLSYAFMFQQDCERLKSCLTRLNVCPLGSGAIAGNPFNIDRNLLASDLGFSSCTMNSMHAVSDRDFIVEFHFWASLTSVHLSKLAEDFLIYSSKEFNFIEISEAYSTGSSLMPQKKNADSLELIRGKTGRIIGNCMSLLVVLKGIPSTFNKDLQEDKEGMFDTYDTMKDILQVTAGTIETLILHRENCMNALSSDMLATDVAYYLVRKGVAFRNAHEMVGRVVAIAEQKQCQLYELPIQAFTNISDKFTDDIKLIWNYENSANQYTTRGGTSKDSVIEQLHHLAKWIQNEEKVIKLS